ncbi:MAG: hypothetical protein ABIR62_05005, partial [Dokdonella sp.]
MNPTLDRATSSIPCNVGSGERSGLLARREQISRGAWFRQIRGYRVRSVLAWMSASTVALAGCAKSVQGVDQAGRTALAIDAAGCPNLSGIYAFSVPDEKGVSYKNSMLEQLAID